MNVPTEAAVLDALRVVRDPDLHKDIVALGFIKNLRINGGHVAFAIELTTPACPVKDLMRDQARAAVEALAGVSSVEIEMTAAVRATAPAAGKVAVPGVQNVIAVGAGKGGVGKTTMTVNLAAALASRGSRVAILDGDIYGPNIPLMLGLQTQLESDGQKIIPAERYGIKVVSVAFLTEDEAPIIWRGPMLHQIIQQFFREVQWGAIDYLLVDMPPGTGDVALSLSQSVPLAGAVLVTTPQAVAVADTRRAINMYRKLGVPTLGIIENMSHFVCTGCGRDADLFGRGGGRALAEAEAVPFLGDVPLQEPVRISGDAGRPIVLADPTSVPALAIIAAAERVAQQVSIASFASRAIPLTEVR
jgi:ATP-binding protein involved in chromosome partitioning